ncbi:antibiotic biosynthesis monooxygenase [Antrihabitans cavernicola]|uniref:ABM domain-containing protein n=1 Tax=Antrihabitans cavernicola TaxID=2495913 RepID=A0A5A7S1U1_9NOCA|nr:antibiotic biosynthesis monooxygenase [Spelaeibacter cavernicola]KAA0017401.1 hypothetical protein FOY51_25230 [Spelaeibacter cavernicola]
MSFGFVAFHYPAPEHVEEFVGRCHQVVEKVSTRSGFHRAEVWITPDGDAVVTTAWFDSKELLGAAFAAAGPQSDELEIKPRKIHFLLSRVAGGL